MGLFSYVQMQKTHEISKSCSIIGTRNYQLINCCFAPFQLNVNLNLPNSSFSLNLNTDRIISHLTTSNIFLNWNVVSLIALRQYTIASKNIFKGLLSLDKPLLSHLHSSSFMYSLVSSLFLGPVLFKLAKFFDNRILHKFIA